MPLLKCLQGGCKHECVRVTLVLLRDKMDCCDTWVWYHPSGWQAEVREKLAEEAITRGRNVVETNLQQVGVYRYPGQAEGRVTLEWDQWRFDVEEPQC